MGSPLQEIQHHRLIVWTTTGDLTSYTLCDLDFIKNMLGIATGAEGSYIGATLPTLTSTMAGRRWRGKNPSFTPHIPTWERPNSANYSNTFVNFGEWGANREALRAPKYSGIEADLTNCLTAASRLLVSLA